MQPTGVGERVEAKNPERETTRSGEPVASLAEEELPAVLRRRYHRPGGCIAGSPAAFSQVGCTSGLVVTNGELLILPFSTLSEARSRL